MLTILTKQEIYKFENELPNFNHQEKVYYFNIPESLIENIQYNDNKIFMTLIYGYFKATNKFYIPILSDENLLFISNKYKYTITDNITKRTFYRFTKTIKQYLDIIDYSTKIESILYNETSIYASNFIHSKKIFYSLVELSKKLKIEVPRYTILSNIISKAINSQKKDILNKLKFYEKDERLNFLDIFLEKN